MTTFHIFSFGVLVHVIFLFAVFDIYFKSTVIVGIAPINNTIPPVGKRVVLISVDGLRADSLVDRDGGNVKNLMPHVKRIMEERGTWGISETHVPTESRPGHVAMLAGFYEDPSAVTKGWKENPVTFDSIFNQSACSFAWGSPDILNVFFNGLERDCAFSYSYENEQNFAGDVMEYDNWVYQEFSSFLMSSPDKMHKSGILIFLHLLGQDTSGHTHKPHTEKYIQNTKNVDRIVHEVEKLVNEHFKDDLTSFVITSDHGMTDWGSHGAGHPNETETPIVAWGAGIPRLPVPVNINQADITPLLAILLGSSIPVNSIGILPIQYIDMSDNYKAKAMLLNAKQIAAQFETNMERVKAQVVSIFHSPFEKLTSDELQLMTSSISKQIENGNYEDAIKRSRVLIEMGLEGLEYYQNYYQRLLLVAVSCSYVLWIFYLGLELCNKPRVAFSKSHSVAELILGSSAVVTFLLILLQRLPLQYSLYLFLPQLLLYLCLKKLRHAHYLLIKRNFYNILTSLLLMTVGVEIIVVSFFRRYLLSASLILTFLWPACSVGPRKCDKIMLSLWVTSGLILSGFCLLPTVGGQPNVILLVSSGFVLFLFLLLMFLFNFHKESIIIFSIRCLTVAAAAWNNAVVHSNFNEEGELSKFNQLLSWGLLLFALIMLVIGEPFIIERLDHVFISFLVPFLLLSVSHEGLFIMFLFIHLRSWIIMEYQNSERHDEKLKRDDLSFSDFRRAYLFLLYVWVSFFGLGNIASLNSFDPAWVRCFLTVFHPFLMSSLILFKTIIPFLMVTCSMRALTVMLKLRPDQLFIIVLIYCNLMGLNFLFFIKNKGSWLDIGSSISHYVIQQVTILFLLILYGVAKFLLSFSISVLPVQGKFRRDFQSVPREPSLPRFYTSHKFHRS